MKIVSNTAHTKSLEELYELYETSINGLSVDEAQKRLETYGKNALKEEERTYFSIFIDQFKSPIVVVLMTAALLSLLMGEMTDTVFITSVVIINSILGFYQEYKAETSIKALKKLTKTHVRVIRMSLEALIPSDEIVMGDVIVLGEGDLISADIRLIDSHGLQADEATLTGESVAAIKDASKTLKKTTPPYERSNTLFSGTLIIKGTAKGLVTATADHTYLASIAKSAQEKSPDSPLTRSLAIFSKRLIIVLSSILFTVGLIGFLSGRSTVDLISVLIAELVSAVPAGLPIVVTFILALGAYRLSKHKVLVRHLPSVESLGSTSVIATDKTGTITQGFLSVKKMKVLDEKALKKCAALCNDATPNGGDPVDIALFNWLDKEFETIQKENRRVFYHPFDPKERLMATVNEDSDKVERLHVKGAYEALSQIAFNSSEELQELQQAHDEMASFGLRLLAFGVSDERWEEPKEWKIRIVGLIGFADAAKIGVKEAVKEANNAGIKMLMITGDNPLTAKVIAQEVGIYKENDNVLSGVLIEEMDDKELSLALKECSVIARALPEHKYRIVKLLQKGGDIVAVTGDGVNDVPALKAADLGIAMGGGSEAAKSTAKMIITDNNLNVIVDAIRQGRIITANLRKVIFYLLATCFDEILLISTAIIIGLPLPVYATQILWINIVTDGVIDKTFPMCREEGDVMKNPPRRLEKQFFDRMQIMRISWISIVNASITLLTFLLMLHNGYDYLSAVTVSFCIVVTSQWVNGILAQKEHEPFLKNIKRSIFINPIIWIGVGLGFVLQAMALYVFPDLLHAKSPDAQMLLFILYATTAVFVLIESYKWIEWLFIHKKAKASA